MDFTKAVTVTFLLVLLTTGPAASSSLGLGLRGILASIHRALVNEGPGSIRVTYPSGEVREFHWMSVKPFLWIYICNICETRPQNCEGDVGYCKLGVRRRRDVRRPQN